MTVVLFLAFLRQLHFLKDNLPGKIHRALQTKLSQLFIPPEDSQWRKSPQRSLHPPHAEKGALGRTA